MEGNKEILYAILSIWSWSLIQFTIVLPNKVKKKNMGQTKPSQARKRVGSSTEHIWCFAFRLPISISQRRSLGS